MFVDLLFASTHLLARLVGQVNAINMLNPHIDADNVITVTEAHLKEEQKQAMEKAMEDYMQLCLKSFSLNRSG